MKRQRLMVAVIVLLILVVIGGGVFIFMERSGKNAPQEYTFSEEIHAHETQEAQSAQTAPADSIRIPGFERLIMDSGNSLQNIVFQNPAENKCYFLIEIELPNGIVIFRSDLLAPGEKIHSIQLDVVPNAGTYKDAILRYYCYDVETLKELNGASIKLTLEVKP